MNIVKAPHRYISESGLPIQFTEYCIDDKGNERIIFKGLTDEELIDILTHRLTYINDDKCPNIENAVRCLKEARRNIECSNKL